jgi:hypothetical protein
MASAAPDGGWQALGSAAGAVQVTVRELEDRIELLEDVLLRMVGVMEAMARIDDGLAKTIEMLLDREIAKAKAAEKPHDRSVY